MKNKKDKYYWFDLFLCFLLLLSCLGVMAISICIQIFIVPLIEIKFFHDIVNSMAIIGIIMGVGSSLVQLFITIMCILDKEIKIENKD